MPTPLRTFQRKQAVVQICPSSVELGNAVAIEGGYTIRAAISQRGQARIIVGDSREETWSGIEQFGFCCRTADPSLPLLCVISRGRKAHAASPEGSTTVFVTEG